MLPPPARGLAKLGATQTWFLAKGPHVRCNLSSTPLGLVSEDWTDSAERKGTAPKDQLGDASPPEAKLKEPRATRRGESSARGPHTGPRREDGRSKNPSVPTWASRSRNRTRRAPNLYPTSSCTFLASHSRAEWIYYVPGGAGWSSECNEPGTPWARTTPASPQHSPSDTL